jgi:hypothetical protein
MSVSDIKSIKFMGSLEVVRPFEYKCSKRDLLVAKKKSTSHDTLKDKHRYEWLRKSIASSSMNSHAVTIEVISQELRRLLDCGPKTRMSFHIADAKSCWGVLSKFIPGFISYQGYEINFYQQILKNYQFGTVSGFGSMLVLSLWLGEIDLKLANFGFIGVDGHKKIVHIDGDCSFASLQKFKAFEYGHNFNFEDINALPALKNYHPHNWLNSVREYRLITTQGSEQVSLDNIRTNPTFRAEVLKMVLIISLLPNNIIDRFVEHYRPSRRDLSKIKNHLEQRRDILYNDLEKIEGFSEFVLTAEAEMAKTDLQNKIMTFYMYSKVQIFDLLPVEKSVTPSDIQSDFKGIFRQNAVSEIEQRFSDIHSLFDKDVSSPDAKRHKI